MAGFDKKDLLPYLATSLDGQSWADISAALQQPGFDITVFVVEDPAGRILAGLLDIEGQRVRIGEVMIVTASRQRPARLP